MPILCQQSKLYNIGSYRASTMLAVVQGLMRRFRRNRPRGLGPFIIRAEGRWRRPCRTVSVMNKNRANLRRGHSYLEIFYQKIRSSRTIKSLAVAKSVDWLFIRRIRFRRPKKQQMSPLSGTTLYGTEKSSLLWPGVDWNISGLVCTSKGSVNRCPTEIVPEVGHALKIWRHW